MTGAQIIAAVFILLVIGYLSSLAVIFIWFSKAMDEDWEDGDPGPKWMSVKIAAFLNRLLIY